MWDRASIKLHLRQVRLPISADFEKFCKQRKDSEVNRMRIANKQQARAGCIQIPTEQLVKLKQKRTREIAHHLQN